MYEFSLKPIIIGLNFKRNFKYTYLFPSVPVISKRNFCLDGLIGSGVQASISIPGTVTLAVGLTFFSASAPLLFV